MKIGSLVIVGLVFIFLGSLVYWGWQRQQVVTSHQGVQVVASFYPLAEFARQVGGELVRVTTVVPADSEPHEYEPTLQELAQVYNASLFIYNGSGVDPWAERIAGELTQKGVHVINISTTMPHLAAPVDPHFWLDPVLAQQQVAVISEALMTIDPGHVAIYEAQSDVYQEQLRMLDQEYRSGLQSCRRRDIVTSHAAFGYLATRYNLSVVTIAGLSPEEEPSARAVSEIAKTAKEKHIKYIFFETLVSPKLAQTVASEIGAQTLVFNPLEGVTDEERQADKNYLSLMRDNLQNLQIALECQ